MKIVIALNIAIAAIYYIIAFSSQKVINRSKVSLDERLSYSFWLQTFHWTIQK